MSGKHTNRKRRVKTSLAAVGLAAGLLLSVSMTALAETAPEDGSEAIEESVSTVSSGSGAAPSQTEGQDETGEGETSTLEADESDAALPTESESGVAAEQNSAEPGSAVEEDSALQNTASPEAAPLAGAASSQQEEIQGAGQQPSVQPLSGTTVAEITSSSPCFNVGDPNHIQLDVTLRANAQPTNFALTLPNGTTRTFPTVPAMTTSFSFYLAQNNPASGDEPGTYTLTSDKGDNVSFTLPDKKDLFTVESLELKKSYIDTNDVGYLVV